jgi:hypothetical protein
MSSERPPVGPIPPIVTEARRPPKPTPAAAPPRPVRPKRPWLISHFPGVSIASLIGYFVGGWWSIIGLFWCGVSVLSMSTQLLFGLWEAPIGTPEGFLQGFWWLAWGLPTVAAAELSYGAALWLLQQGVSARKITFNEHDVV